MGWRVNHTTPLGEGQTTHTHRVACLIKGTKIVLSEAVGLRVPLFARFFAHFLVLLQAELPGLIAHGFTEVEAPRRLLCER